ncbi:MULTISPECIES: hypothetical protein [unclassified Sphingomonas]|uniref:hypothetical protein n=1 Tax=Novosphingobium rhizosphaerae TaxID=1551649 RepID=UPI0015CBEFE1
MTRKVAWFGGVGLVLAVVAGAVLLPRAGQAAAQGCFGARDSARLSFRLFQQAPPPSAGARDYPAYPLTDAATMQLGKLAGAAPNVGGWYFQWGNRSTAPLFNAAGRQLPRKPNFQPSAGALRQQRTPFTSVARANACTLAQTAHLLGQDDAAQAFAREGGIATIAQGRQPDVGAVGPADRCVLADGRLPAKARGVFLDYEVGDGRTPQDSLQFLRRFAALVHGAGRQAGVMINPLDAPSQKWTGITGAVAHDVVATFDFTTIWLWGRNAQGSLPASYARQMDILRQGGPVDGRRILALFDLNQTTPADAAFVHRAIVQDRLAGAMLWRNRAVQGGACNTDVAIKTAIVAFGQPPQKRAF